MEHRTTEHESQPPQAPPRRYVWQCLDDDCGHTETADHQTAIKRCPCGCVMWAIADVEPDDKVS